MNKLMPCLFFGGLVAWVAALLVTALAHSDLPLWGRSRYFPLITSMLFFSTTVCGIVWAARNSKLLLTPMVITVVWWSVAGYGIGGRTLIPAMFGPPSEERIREIAQANGYPEDWTEKALHGPAMSAASSYMVDAYLWGLLSEVRTPWVANTSEQDRGPEHSHRTSF